MARVKSWPSMEINGWIYLWHHAEGIEPNWLPPELEEVTNGTWQYGGRSEHHINSHIEVGPQCTLASAYMVQKYIHIPLTQSSLFSHHMFEVKGVCL